LTYEGELKLIDTLRSFPVNIIHKLEQKKIADYLAASSEGVFWKGNEWLRRNRMLPRKKETNEIDLLVWKNNHWAALALEQKNQKGVKKVLELYDNGLTLKAFGKKEIFEHKNNARNLLLQCIGESYLGQAFMAAKGEVKKVIPVAVVDYEIRVREKDARWAWHNGVFFVKEEHFSDFFRGYYEDADWFKRTVVNKPRIASDKA
jgi:hypothetical protein